ncbi:hypothetical protein ACFPL7_13665 [Dongia soli]|uniref:Dolichyl-phosphate-mannose-protein mannosyltransferase n=1 Tax=Dongia soli TaxID=600628 RepID=A0ABU5ECL9_9PROT|nr:hypothetical protein [Dongia soli]MDY0884057.1 hypothetical protein [Dongia soli]
MTSASVGQGKNLRTILGIVCVLIAAALIVRLVLVDVGLATPIHRKYVDMSAPGLLPALFLHVGFGLILLYGGLATGLGILTFAPASWNLTVIDRQMISLPLGILVWLIICALVQFAGGSSYLILALALGLPLLRIVQIRRDLNSGGNDSSAAASGWSSHLIIFALASAFAVHFGLLWRMPTVYGSGTLDLGDITVYAANYHALKKSLFTVIPLTVEGDRLGPPVNQIASFLAFAFDDIPAFDISLFITASVPFFFFMAVCYGGRTLLRYRAECGTEPISAIRICAVILMICAATRYPSWIVESPPYAFAIPFGLSIAYLAARGEDRHGFFFILAPLTAICFAISKVVVIAVFGSYVLCRFAGVVLASKSPRSTFFLLFGAVICGGFAIGLLSYYGPIFAGYASAQDFGPNSFRVLFYGITVDSTNRALPFLAGDLGYILLIVGAWRLRDYPTAIAVAVAMALFFFYPFLFNGTASSALALVAFALLTGQIGRGQPDRAPDYLFILASLLTLFGQAYRDPGKWEFVLLWTVLFGGALIIALSPFTADAHRPATQTRKGRLGRCWRYALPIAVIVTVFAHADGDLKFVGKWRNVVPPKLYDLWRKVAELTPPNALIFTDQTGDQPSRFEGWNDLSATADRQFYISSWSVSPLRSDPAARQHRLELNDAVISGRLRPNALTLHGSYEGYFLALRAERQPPETAISIYNNGEYAIYRLP